jgi:hypothetical protein
MKMVEIMMLLCKLGMRMKLYGGWLVGLLKVLRTYRK